MSDDEREALDCLEGHHCGDCARYAHHHCYHCGKRSGLSHPTWCPNFDSAPEMTPDEPVPPRSYCETCQIPGAPAHDPSPKCHYRAYGKVAHCTCQACWG